MKPTFAVVGHPNKGKSSIVATLAQNDSIAISAQSGTTRLTETLTITVGNSEYRLVDTPGFQRPAKVLHWLQAHAESADQRRAAVARFVDDPQCQRDFADEVQLLRPIMEGAAILYVVDGSRPYGVDYEAEMEVLRWTGQASIALINPIENERYIDAWQQALSQYFKVVKVFNPMQADFDKRLSILETFAQLKDEWRDDINRLLVEYKREVTVRRERSVLLLAEMLVDLCSYQVSQKTLSKSQAKTLQPMLEKRYFAEMQRRESDAHEALKRIHAYHHLQSEIGDLPFEEDLFDTEKWIVWGLNRTQLATAAAMAGAAVGAAFDVAMLGGSLMLGALTGGVVAGGSAWLGADQLAGFRIKGLPLGGFEARVGPIRNRNFPYVLLGRFLSLEQTLSGRTHAHRDSIHIGEGDLAGLIERLTPAQQRTLHTALDRLRQQRPVDTLSASLGPLFAAVNLRG